MKIVGSDDTFDAEADATITTCLKLDAPKSFFLYAGAGSGKTRSLVEAIRTVCREQGRRLSLSSQKIGVITYTNAACDEIKQRLEFDPRVEVSTIHAFAWSLISGYNDDIRGWLVANLFGEIEEIERLQSKGRKDSKAAVDRTRSIESKQRRLAGLSEISKFIYSPTSDNRTRDAVNHSEVIAMTANFLTTKSGLRRLLTARFPILLIDESQDTNHRLMDALLDVQAAHKNVFSLGLFGDTMQRIFSEGKEKLSQAIPHDWEQPRKSMNHRCPVRIVALINKIRADDDQQEQCHRTGAQQGLVRLFLAPESIQNPSQLESSIAVKMAEISGDKNWSNGDDKVKTLALEHLMSARRFGFEEFFAPLYASERIRTGLLDGTGRGLGFFIRELIPLTTALAANDKFAIAAIIKKTSPLLSYESFVTAAKDQHKLLQKAQAACDGLKILLSGDESPSIRTVLRYIADVGLFVVPDVLAPFTREDEIDFTDSDVKVEEVEDAKTETGAWRLALEAPFQQVHKYDRYVRGISQFDTHQGVKGLEFPRVMVVISDLEARGFMFSYGKLIGIKAKSKTDIENELAGRETTIDRTRRLFYVTCSRAEKSLAIVYYSDNPVAARDSMITKGWFSNEEIEIIQ